MLFMVVERFKDRDPVPIYARLAAKGRMMPAGLKYVGSWIETSFDRCFQVMECHDERLFHEWTEQWRDLMDFEIVPVMTSQEARAAAEALAARDR
jgi:hypothetical protein